MNRRTSARPTLATLLLAGLIPFASGVANAQVGPAQPIERFVPERPEVQPVEIAPAIPIAIDADEQSLGVDLRAIAFIGADDAVLEKASGEIDTTRVVRLDDPAFRAQIAPYVGAPISLAMIAEIEALVATRYREAGFPFVSVSTPPQEVSGGLLQIRVVEFRAGAVTSDGGARISGEQAVAGVRLQPGETIDALRLSEDLTWLNRNPFRRMEAIFSPGGALGETLLDIRVDEVKPWQLSGGYSNSGAGGADRYFLGATVADVPLSGVLASYQFTTGRDFFQNRARSFGRRQIPSFVSHGGFIAIPVAPRQEIEIVASHVTTRENTQTVFDIERRTLEGRIAWRSALSNFAPLWGDILVGFEARAQEREVYFSGLPLTRDRIEIYQGVLGWAHRFNWALGATSLDIRGHYSPGGITRRNRDAAFSAFTLGRVASARYGYASLSFEHVMPLPGEFSFVLSGRGRVSSGPLPETEQLSLTGADAVRGYRSQGGGVDFGVYARNELRLPVLRVAEGALNLQPYVFLDAGHGGRHKNGGSATVASVGAGLDFALGAMVSGAVDVGHTLRRTTVSRRGETAVNFRLTARY